MTPLSPARRDAEAFARAVDGARGDVADRYSDLLTCVDVLREQEIPAPRADFVADLRMRLMDAADTLLVPAEATLAPVVPLQQPSTNRRQRRISIAAAALVVVGGTAGVAAAAENALPGDALYPLKRSIESAQVSLNGSDSGKGQDLLRQAGTRLNEVDGLLTKNDSTTQITHTLSSFKRSATDGADLLFVDFQRTGDTETISRLRAMLSSQLTKLDSLSSDAPADARPAFAAARQLLSDLDQQASVLCADCGPGGISEKLRISSAPALGSLFELPVSRAEHKAAVEARNQAELAGKAGQIAKSTKTDNTPATPDSSGKTADDPDVDPGTGLPVPTPPKVGGLTGVVGGLTSGVSALLGGGGTPLTDTLNNTLATLTGLLPK
ncbi:hypothetical protein EFK50_10795 [Nocardioides marmoriginsengisoli]|uniref:DUF5667 domain-containing protein n=1 Tax=Nocardioides marmoriginsengisoli TaxID=661483 RepID=A0A3N0CFP0_9ACTN|nr:DUF5667 domain-containing protein [Nocardioides marmoriginsengisoli]RNL62265.1 hypothetical protein EFK50_10795 [Nocardioides marmoriginsengisoli]